MPAVLAFPASLRRFEKRLAASLRGLLVQADLDEKHRKMEEDPFTFLRATCWRWAETVPALVPELMDAPVVLSLGDAHLDNFGLWRDSETRLVWGANDFDEAWPLPYTQDLLRHVMAHELASLHAGTPGGAKRIQADLKSRPRGWLLAAAKLAARQTEADFGTWQHHRKAHKR